jgi:ATP-dependent RNA helicase DDX52/ROK1
LQGTKFQVRLLDKSTASKNSFGADSSQKFDIVISTPLRLVKSLAEESLSLHNVEWLVLDEADRLFENGFEHQVDEILAACGGPKRRIALFSATMPQRVEELASTVLHDPIRFWSWVFCWFCCCY